MRKFVVIASVSSMVLSGCSTLLSPENSVTSTYHSTHSAEQTYRNLLRVARECYPTGVGIEQVYLPEAKEGEILLAPTTDLNKFEWAKLTVKADQVGSTVQLQRHSRFVRFEPVMTDWIEGRAPVCPYGTRSEPMPPGSERSHQNYPTR